MSPAEAKQAFHEFSRSIAQEFLQTVLVVDDKAESNVFGTQESPKVYARVGEGSNTEAARGTRTSKLRKSSPAAKETKKADNEIDKKDISGEIIEKDEPDVLPIKILNQAFANKGIICGFLSPASDGTNREDVITAAEITAKRADIIILDWKMEEDDETREEGYTAKRIIKSILQNDKGKDKTFQVEGRLRLIAIYSQSTYLQRIISEIATSLQEENPRLTFINKGPFAIHHDSTHIYAFKKAAKTAIEVGDPLSERAVSVDELTDRLINEFATITEGLLSNVAIAAMSSLRSNTHKILKKFNSKLDTPYITHRALTTPSEEAQEHPIALIASEIEDVLAGHNISDAISPVQIRLWIKSLPERISFKTALQMKSDILLNHLEETAIHGSKYLRDSGKPWQEFYNGKNQHKDSLLTNLMLDDDSGKIRDREFAVLTTTRSHYTVPPPHLTLGTIIAIPLYSPVLAVKSNQHYRYYVCIQPVCDCVRLEDERTFPFLELELAKDSKFDLVIKHHEHLIEFNVRYKPHDVKLLDFYPTEKLIKAKGKPGNWFFMGKDFPASFVKCHWVADLKFAHAQRIAERFGGQISRVGLMESDWLRRMSGEKES